MRNINWDKIDWDKIIDAVAELIKALMKEGLSKSEATTKAVDTISDKYNVSVGSIIKHFK